MSLLWEWNGADASQFDAPLSFSQGGWPGPSGAALSVVADANVPGGQKLRFDTAGGTGTGCAVALITDPIAQLDRTLLVEMELANQSAQYGGISYLAEVNGGNLFAINRLVSAGWASRIDAGTMTSSGGTNGTLVPQARSGLVRLRLRATKAASSPPRFWEHGEGNCEGSTPAGAGALAGTERNDAYYDAVVGSAFPASWDPLTDLNRLGLCIQASGGGAFGVLDIARLRVFDDPLADGGASDGTPPTVTYELSSGSQLGQNDAFPVTVTDALGLAHVSIGVEYPTGEDEDRGYDVVFDGSRFTSAYRSSEREAIADGYRFHIRKRGGWPPGWQVTPHVFAVNTAGVVA